MSHLRFTCPAMALLLLGGCTAQELSRNVYEGSRVHNESLRADPLDKASTPVPDFDQYDRERRALSTPRSD